MLHGGFYDLETKTQADELKLSLDRVTIRRGQNRGGDGPSGASARPSPLARPNRRPEILRDAFDGETSGPA